MNNIYDDINHYEELSYDYLELNNDEDSSVYESMDGELDIRDSKDFRNTNPQESREDLDHRIYENISIYMNRCELKPTDLRQPNASLKSSNKFTVNSSQNSQKYNKIQEEDIYSIPKRLFSLIILQ